MWGGPWPVPLSSLWERAKGALPSWCVALLSRAHSWQPELRCVCAGNHRHAGSCSPAVLGSGCHRGWEVSRGYSSGTRLHAKLGTSSSCTWIGAPVSWLLSLFSVLLFQFTPCPTARVIFVNAHLGSSTCLRFPAEAVSQPGMRPCEKWAHFCTAAKDRLFCEAVKSRDLET